MSVKAKNEVKLIKKTWPLILLGCLGLVIFWNTYVPGTFLLGWDNLFVEGDWWLNLRRNLWGVWLEYRGLGLLDGMSFIANLPHTLLVGLLVWWLPLNMVRYVVILGLHTLGMVGMYWLLRRVLGVRSEWVALAGAIFYGLNSSVIQMFFTPYEVFVFHFVALPWMSGLLVSYLKTGSKWWLLWLGLTSFMMTPQGHVPTVFLVYAMMMGFIWFGYLVNRKIRVGGRLVASLGVLLATNAFWVLPYAYSLPNNFETIRDSKINQMSTDEVWLYNKVFADFESVALMRGFNLIFTDIDGDEFVYLMDGWRDWLFSPAAVAVQWVMFGLAVVGGLVIVGYRRREWWPFLGGFLLGFLVLGHEMAGVAWIWGSLFEPGGLAYQAFRFVFTKFAVLYAFGFAVLLVAGIEFMGKQWEWLSKVTAVLAIVGCLYVAMPVFRGDLFYNNLRIEIPESYWELEEYFGTLEGDFRIGQWPQMTYWGWTNNRWGYRGSGWLWQMIDQPMMDRAFDPWSSLNEGYYFELSTAASGLDVDGLGRVLEKYGVDYMLIDESIYLPGVELEDMKVDWVRGVLGELGWERVFEEEIVGSDKILSSRQESGLQNDGNFGRLEVWGRGSGQWSVDGGQGEVGIDSRLRGNDKDGFVWAPESFSVVDASKSKVRRDVVYESVGTYVSTENQESRIMNYGSENQIRYPFAGVMGEGLGEFVRFGARGLEFVAEGGSGLDGIGALREGLDDSVKVVLPGFGEGEWVPVRVNYVLENGEVRVGLESGIEVGVGLERDSSTSVGMTNAQKLNGIATSQAPRNDVALSVGEGVLEVMVGVVTGGGVETVRLREGERQEKLVSLQVGEVVGVRVYDVSEAYWVDVSEQMDSLRTSQCWTRSGYEGMVRFDRGVDDVGVTARDASGCVSYWLGQYEPGLLEVSVPYRSLDGARPHFCVTREGGVYRCEHRDVYYEADTSLDWSMVSRQVMVDAGVTYWLDVSARPPEQVGRQWTISYGLPELRFYPLVEEVSMGVGFWDEWREERVVDIVSDELGEGSSLAVRIPGEPVVVRPGLGKVDNCDVFGRGDVGVERRAEGLEYWARDRGAACEGLVMPNMDVGKSYALRVVGENLAGRSMKMYVSNWASERADVEVLLPRGAFDEVFGLLSWPNLEGSGYTFNVETRSFGREESRNRLDAVEVWEVPSGWISRIRMVGGPSIAESRTGSLRAQDDTLDLESLSSVSNYLIVGEVRKWGTGHYMVKVEQVEQVEQVGQARVVDGGPAERADTTLSVVALGQGYDEGWRAYQLPVTSNQIAVIMPWWFGERLEQVKVNGWGNGWVVDESWSTDYESREIGEPAERADTTLSVVIVYWPQYLQWLGMGVLLVAGGWLGISFSRFRIRQRVENFGD